jgi:serine/threonine-protein kinase
MSPEQFAARKDMDHRTDLWSLGVVVFECLTGKRPFEAETIGALAIAVHSGEMPVPSHLFPELAPVDGWFAKACCRKVEGRFQTAKEFAEAFAAAAGEARPRAMSGPDFAPAALPSSPATGEERVGLAATPALLLSTGASTVVSSQHAAPRKRSPMPALYGAVAAVAILGVVGVVVAQRHASPGSATADAPAPSSLVAKPAPSSAPSASAAPPPAVSVADNPAPSEPQRTVPSSSPSPSSPATARPVRPAAGPLATSATPPPHTATTHAASPPAKDCSNPFTVDAAGVKHPRPECL